MRGINNLWMVESTESCIFMEVFFYSILHINTSAYIINSYAGTDKTFDHVVLIPQLRASITIGARSASILKRRKSFPSFESLVPLLLRIKELVNPSGCYLITLGPWCEKFSTLNAVSLTPGTIRVARSQE